MKGIRDWLFTQLVASSRPFPSGTGSLFPEVDDSNGSAHMACLEVSSLPSETSASSQSNLENSSHPSPSQVIGGSHQASHGANVENIDALAKIEDLRIKFFRLLRRLGLSQDNLLVAKVLYRVHLASLIRAGESDLKRVRNDRPKAIAAEQEASGVPELNFSVRILVLGKTGVGKSATINSIFDQRKAATDAFQPATDCIQEVVGTVNGVKITFIDTPGFLPSSTNTMRKNRKIMLSVKRFIKKSPPDIVLFFERLDLINMAYCDFPLVKLMTDVFGSAIWFNTILVMTHASSAPPEGPNGYPVSYESYVTHCTDLMQHDIHQSVSDSKLENPVLLVENHPQSRKNVSGETILPNGEVWKSQFLLLCICTKVLGDVNALLEFQDSIELGPKISPRVPSLPHLLSSLLRHRSMSSPGEENRDIDEILLSDADEDEYDQLPPIRMLTKSQFERLTKSQKNDYLDELDYRETLYLKKKLKEEACRRKVKNLSEVEDVGEDRNSDDQKASPDTFLLPDMAIPPNFDSDCPAHRYRCLATGDQLLVRPVLDPHGWDHDVGFDGINLETAVEVKSNIYASITGQMSKDKQEFSIQSECAAVYTDPVGPSYSVGIDAQSAGKDMIYTIHSNTKFKYLKQNVTDCGFSVTSFANKYYIGAKLEDTLLVGKRLKFVVNAGQMSGPGQVAYGGGFEATLRGRDYPVRNDNVSLSMTALSFNKEMVLSGGFQSEFRPIRGTTVAVNANLNTQRMGQVSIKLSSSEHIEVAFIAIFSILKALMRRRDNNGSLQALEMG